MLLSLADALRRVQNDIATLLQPEPLASSAGTAATACASGSSDR